MTEAKQNYSFEENYFGVRQVLVTNNLGRAIEHLEIVYLDGLVGECVEFDGIANGASGYINIADERVISTEQIETTDTFVVGGMVYFVSGGAAAAGKLRAGAGHGGVPVGVCTAVIAGVAVEFRTMKQNVGGPESLRATTIAITASAAAGLSLADKIPIGAKVIDAFVVGTAVSAGGTVTIEQDGGDDICVLTCAAVGTLTRATSLANTVVLTPGIKITGSAAGVRGEVTIFWR